MAMQKTEKQTKLGKPSRICSHCFYVEVPFYLEQSISFLFFLLIIFSIYVRIWQVSIWRIPNTETFTKRSLNISEISPISPIGPNYI